jgi:hypothetical protein
MNEKKIADISFLPEAVAGMSRLLISPSSFPGGR